MRTIKDVSADMDNLKQISNLNEKIKKIKMLQDELIDVLAYRTVIENEALKLISEGNNEKANMLLKTIE